MLNLSWLTGARALDIAAELHRRAMDSGAPPVVVALPPRPRRAYDRLVDALNRLPRPIMVLGSLALMGAAVVAPDWFTARMDALAQMPEGMWWLVGAVLSLHFGARAQSRAQDHERAIVEAAVATAPKAPPRPEPVATPRAAAERLTGPNAALDDWLASRR